LYLLNTIFFKWKNIKSFLKAEPSTTGMLDCLTTVTAACKNAL